MYRIPQLRFRMSSLLLLLGIACTMISCDSLIADDPENLFILETEADLEMALAGLYYKSAKILTPENSYCIQGYADDIVTQLSFWGSYLLYSDSYEAIACANDLLKKSEGLELTPGVKNLLGEVYFLRAWVYYVLARYFGQPPLIYDTDFSYSLEKPGYEAVYDSIEADLQRALDWVPSDFEASRVPWQTPHAGTVKALWAKVLLSRGGYPVYDASAYSRCWKMAEEVMDAAEQYQYALLNDFAQLWDGRHNFNSEGVFAFFYLNGGWLSSDYQWVTDSLSALPQYGNVLRISWPGFLRGTCGWNFFNRFPQQYRKDKTYNTHQIANIDFEWDTVYIAQIDEVFTTSMSMSMKKYHSAVDSLFRTVIGGGVFDDRNPYTGRTLYLIRYAGTLLTYAEAKARDGQLDASACEAVNRVKRRAYFVDPDTPSAYDLQEGLSTEAFIDSVVWERAWEFCGEPGNRWADLLRLGQAGHVAELIAPQTCTFEELNEKYFMDIPAPDAGLFSDENEEEK